VKEKIEQVIAELETKINNHTGKAPDAYLAGYDDGVRTLAELTIYKLKEVLSSDPMEHTTETKSKA
jgi:hypothetical protein